MVSCYPEIAFHDNREDVEFILSNKETIADALCRGICAFLGVEYKAPEGTDLQAEIDRLEQEISVRDEQTAELHDRIDRLNDEMESKHEEIKTRERQTQELAENITAIKAGKAARSGCGGGKELPIFGGLAPSFFIAKTQMYKILHKKH